MSLERHVECRAPPDQHIIVAGMHARRRAESRTISRNRRRTRLRSTALPTCRDTVKPTRTGAVLGAPARLQHEGAGRTPAVRPRRHESPPGASAAPWYGRHGAADWQRLRSRTEPLAALRAPGRQHLAAAFGRHAGAKTVTALAHQFARLIGPFHGIDLRSARFAAQSMRRHMSIGARLARLIREPSRPVNVNGRAARQAAKPLCTYRFSPDDRVAACIERIARMCEADDAGKQLKPDICVIGAGAGGRAAAAAAAAFGVPVVLIEKGGSAAMPATAAACRRRRSRAAAERANIIRNAARFGLKAARFGVDFAAVQGASARRHRRRGAERDARAFRRPRRARHRRRGAVHGRAHRRRRRLHHHGAPLRHRHRLVAGAAGDPRPCRHAAPHQRHRVRSRRLPAPSHRHRRRRRSASNWRRRFAGSAPRSRCSKRRRRLPATIPNAPPSCSMRSKREGIMLRIGVTIAQVRARAGADRDR